MRRLSQLLAVLLHLFLACYVSSTGPASAAEVTTLIKGPYLQAPTSSSMEIRWEAATKKPGMVEWGRSPDALNNTTRAQVQTIDVTEYINRELAVKAVAHLQRAILTPLEPGTKYCYRVRQGTTVTQTFGFRTVPTRPTRFRFVAYGDNRSYPGDHRKVATGIMSAKPDFVLNTGDLVAHGDDWPLWSREFFSPLHPLAAQVPVWVARGNHDGSAKYIIPQFHFPGPKGRCYYRFDYGSARFICLDGTLGKSRPAMFAWMEEQLREGPRPRWKFVFLHYPSFGASAKRNYSRGYERERMSLLCQRYGIDIVFTGHDHDYMRTVPILADRTMRGGPTTHVVTGGGGAPTYTLGHATWIASGAELHHYCVIDIDSRKLDMVVYEADQGKVIDRLSIEKDERGKVIAPPDYRKRARTVSDINALEQLRRHLTAFGLPALRAGQRAVLESLVSNPFDGSVKVTVSFKGSPARWVIPAPLTLVLPAKAAGVPFKMEPTARKSMSDQYNAGYLMVEYELPDGRTGIMRGEGIYIEEELR